MRQQANSKRLRDGYVSLHAVIQGRFGHEWPRTKPSLPGRCFKMGKTSGPLPDLLVRFGSVMDVGACFVICLKQISFQLSTFRPPVLAALHRLVAVRLSALFASLTPNGFAVLSEAAEVGPGLLDLSG